MWEFDWRGRRRACGRRRLRSRCTTEALQGEGHLACGADRDRAEREVLVLAGRDDAAEGDVILEDRLDVLVVSDEERRIAEVDLARFGHRETTEDPTGHNKNHEEKVAKKAIIPENQTAQPKLMQEFIKKTSATSEIG